MNDPNDPQARPDVFALPEAESSPMSSVPMPIPARKTDTKTVKIVAFVGVMGCVTATVAYFAIFQGNEATTPGTTRPPGAAIGGGGVGLREDQTKDFERLMTALAQDRKRAKEENDKILVSLNRIESTQASSEKRTKRLEEISAELISRGLVKENAQNDAANLPEQLQPLMGPAIAFCRKALTENGWYGWNALKGPFTEWVLTQSPNVSAEDTKRLHDLAQVPREPIADTHYDLIPPLTRKRLAMRIQREDLSALVNLVWQERAILPPTTPGQYISLAILAGRAENAKSGTATVANEIGGSGLQEYQDLVVPRDMRIGFMPCRSTDVVQIVSLAIPYLTGGSSIPEQDPTVVVYGTLRAKNIATTFLKRLNDRPGSLIAAFVEEVQRQERIPRPLLTIKGDIDERTKEFAAAAIRGMVIGRGVREGIIEPARLNGWATEMADSISQETLSAIDLSLPHRAYATISSRDLNSPIVPPVVAEAFDRSFRVAVEKHGKELAAGDRQRFLVLAAIQGATAAIVHARMTDQTSAESMGAVITRAVKVAAAQVEAQASVRRQIEEDLIPAYAGLYEGSTRDWVGGIPGFADVGNIAIDTSMASRAFEDPAPDLASRLAITGRVEVDTAMARLAAVDSINRDIDRFATQAPLTLIKSARDHAFARVNQAINSTVPKDVQIRQTYAIARESIAIAQGKRRIRTINPATVAVTPTSVGPTSTAPGAGAPGTLPIEEPEAIQVFRPTSATAPTIKYVTIPAGAYAEARVIAGVVCELGETRPEPMLLNLDYSWSGPAGSTLIMKDLRLVSDCWAMGGAPRVRTKINTISFTLPDKTQVTVPCDGWCVDNVQGQGGIIGVWDWNLDTVVPLGTANGLLTALGSLLEPNQQVTSVNTSVTIIDSEKQSAGEKLGKGAADGLKDTVGNHITKTLDNIKPAIFVQNNQPCTVILKADVILPIPADQWALAVQESVSSGKTGFVR